MEHYQEFVSSMYLSDNDTLENYCKKIQNYSKKDMDKILDSFLLGKTYDLYHDIFKYDYYDKYMQIFASYYQFETGKIYGFQQTLFK